MLSTTSTRLIMAGPSTSATMSGMLPWRDATRRSWINPLDPLPRGLRLTIALSNKEPSREPVSCQRRCWRI